MATLKQFSLKMIKRSRQVMTGSAAVKRKVAIVVVSVLANETPRDTGRALSNWLAGLRQPKRQVVEPRSTEQTLSAAKKVVERSQSEEIVWVSNNVKYINELNAGSSQQRPEGFVEDAIQKSVRAVRNSKVLE